MLLSIPQKSSAFKICWSGARKARFSVIIWNRFGADSVNSSNDCTLVQTGWKLSACQILPFDRGVLMKVKFFIEISSWGGGKCLEMIMIFTLLLGILGFVGSGFFLHLVESIFPFKFQFNVFKANKSSLYYIKSTEVSVKYNSCQRAGFYTKLHLSFFSLCNTEVFEKGPYE